MVQTMDYFINEEKAEQIVNQQEDNNKDINASLRLALTNDLFVYQLSFQLSENIEIYLLSLPRDENLFSEIYKFMLSEIPKSEMFKIINNMNDEINAYIDELELKYLNDLYTTRANFELAYNNFSFNDEALLNAIKSHEKKDIFLFIKNCLLHRALGRIAFNNGDYSLAIEYLEASKRDEGMIIFMNGNFVDILMKKDYSKRNTANATKRWNDTIRLQRERYLDLYQQRSTQLGKALKIKNVAMWIYNNHNEFDREYETIRDHLSQALKGNFDN